MMDSGYSSSIIERSLVLLEVFSYIEYSLKEVPYSKVLEGFRVLLGEVGGF